MRANLYKFAILLAVLSVLGAGSAMADSARANGVININTASLEQLQLLPGIGLSKAQAIVEHRARQPFAKPEDLIKVKGIGKGLLKKVRKRVVIKGKTTAKLAKQKKPTKRKK